MPLAELTAKLEHEQKRLRHLGTAVIVLGLFIMLCGVGLAIGLKQQHDTEECVKDTRTAAIDWLDDIERLIKQQATTPQQRADAQQQTIDSIAAYRSELEDCVAIDGESS